MSGDSGDKNPWSGKVIRWRDGERLYAKNDFVTMVYVVTDNPEKVRRLGLHGDDKMVVEFIDQETADRWPDARADAASPTAVTEPHNNQRA